MITTLEFCLLGTYLKLSRRMMTVERSSRVEAPGIFFCYQKSLIDLLTFIYGYHFGLSTHIYLLTKIVEMNDVRRRALPFGLFCYQTSLYYHTDLLTFH